MHGWYEMWIYKFSRFHSTFFRSQLFILLSFHLHPVDVVFTRHGLKLEAYKHIPGWRCGQAPVNMSLINHFAHSFSQGKQHWHTESSHFCTSFFFASNSFATLAWWWDVCERSKMIVNVLRLNFIDFLLFVESFFSCSLSSTSCERARPLISTNNFFARLTCTGGW